MHAMWVVAICYLSVNVLCALLLHLHSMHQAHLPPRPLEVILHFVVLSALGVPILLVMMVEGLFGRDARAARGPYRPIAQHH